MPRPKKTDRPIEKSISLPQSLVARIDALLYSELEGRVPFSAWSQFTIAALEAQLARIDAAAAAMASTQGGQDA